MLRTSSYLAIAISLTTIGFAATPASASQVFVGANPHIAAQLGPVRAATGMEASREASRMLGPQKVVDYPTKIPGMGPSRTSLGNAEQPMPKSHGGDTMTNAEIPKKNLPPMDICATHPYLAFCHTGGGGTGGGAGGGTGGSAG